MNDMAQKSTIAHGTQPHQPGARKSVSFRPDIEGLRGIAVLLVVAFHSHLLLFRGGFLGVDIFFVLSGYLITALLLQELETTGTLSLVGFYARRARRLLPAAAVVVAFIVVAGIFLLSPIEQLLYSKTALATTLYASNLWFIHQSSDYFAADTANNPLLHTWSLAVEEQFYFVWPILVWVGFRLTRSRSGLGKILGAISALSFVACIWLTRTHQPWAFFGSPARAWEFGVGGIACMIPVAMFTSRNWKMIVSWTSLALVFAAAMLFHPGLAFPGWIAVIPALATAMLLIVGAAEVTAGAGKMLAHPILQWFGRLSYSWYLWHWPLLIFAMVLFPNISTYGRLLAVTVALLAAFVTQRAIENPVRFHRGLLTRPVLCLGLAAMLMVVNIGISFGSYRLSRNREMIPGQRELEAVVDEFSPLSNSGCIANFGETHARPCVFGDKEAVTTVALFGDSHAAHWFPPIQKIAQEKKWKLVTFLKFACPTADVAVYNPHLGRVETECAQWRAEAVKEIVALHPDLIIIGNSAGYVQAPNRQDGYGTSTPTEWEEGMHSTVATFDRARLRTVVLHDVPLPRMDVPICLSRVLAHRWYPATWCTPSRTEALDPDVLRAEQGAARGLGRVSVIDLSDVFCDASTCKVEEHGEPIYRDQDHLEATFSRSLAPLLLVKLSGLVNPTSLTSR
ncbi:MAG: acyltransferase family protein [Terriglobales bacterium]